MIFLSEGPGVALVRARLLSTKNRFLLTRRRHPVRVGLQIGLLAPLMIGLAAVFAYGMSLRYEMAPTEREETAMLAAFFALFVVGGFIGIATAALHALYLSEDVPFMLTLPVPLGMTFASKMTDASTGSLPAVILALSGAGGFAIVHSWSPLVIVCAVVGFIALLAATSALAVTFVSLVTRYVPPARARAFLLLTGFILVGLSAATWPQVAPHRNAQGQETAGLSFAGRLIAHSPAGWIAESMRAAADGAALSAFAWLGLASLGAVAFSIVSYFAFRHVYLGSIDRATESRPAARNRLGNAATLLAMARLVPEPARAIALKEWLTLARDLRRLSGIVLPALVVLFYTVILGKRGGSSGYDSELRFWLSNGSLALLPWGFSLGVSLYAFGSEGRGIALIRSLPLTPRRLLWSKIFASFVPIALASLAIAAITLLLRGASARDSAEMLALVLWMTVGFVIIDTAASTIAPNFEVLQITRAIGLTGRAFGLAAGGGFGLATVLGVARLVFFVNGAPESLRSALDGPNQSTSLVGLPLALSSLMVAAAIVAVTLSISQRRVARMLRES